MSRHMIAAQQELFDSLDQFCERAGTAMTLAGRKRYITASSELARERLKQLTCRGVQRFTPHSALLYLESENSGHFAVSVGLREESMDYLETYSPFAMDSGVFQVAILESRVVPNVEPDVVKDAIDWGAADSADYKGHPFIQVAQLFPAVAAVELPSPLGPQEVAALFWKIVVAHCRYGTSWIEEGLANELLTLGQVPVPGLPYGELCWAALSHDPRSLFLALYRCLEAAYAFDVANRVNSELGLTCPWQRTARVLGTQAGWRPHEENSLVELLTNADMADVETIAKSLNSQKDDVREGAGASIYRLRNAIVHYRPDSDLVEIDAYDWLDLCSALSRIVVSVLSVVHRLGDAG